MEIQGTEYNGWVGRIYFTYEGVKRNLTCIRGCAGKKFNEVISVDKDRDTNGVSTWCNNGKSCRFVFNGINTKQLKV